MDLNYSPTYYVYSFIIFELCFCWRKRLESKASQDRNQCRSPNYIVTTVDAAVFEARWLLLSRVFGDLLVGFVWDKKYVVNFFHDIFLNPSFVLETCCIPNDVLNRGHVWGILREWMRDARRREHKNGDPKRTAEGMANIQRHWMSQS